MIAVERSPCPKSLNPADATSAGAKELARFIQALTDDDVLPSAEDYRAYTGADVREALTVLFHGKCAFCESGISGSSQTDIEHFRPKGAVKDADDIGVNHPGYWWLAMVWENLLLSCMHCNQHRRQLILAPDMSEKQIKKAIEQNDLQTTGKKNAFPVDGNIWVTDHTASVATEKPLLLDPTSVNPEPHLEWAFDGTISTVKSRNASPQAEKTIAVLGLNRRHLTEDRMKTLSLMRVHADILRETVERVGTAATPEAAEAFRLAALGMLRGMAEFGKKDKNFAGMARAYFNDVSKMVASALRA